MDKICANEKALVEMSSVGTEQALERVKTAFKVLNGVLQQG